MVIELSATRFSVISIAPPFLTASLRSAQLATGTGSAAWALGIPVFAGAGLSTEKTIRAAISKLSAFLVALFFTLSSSQMIK